MIGLKQEAFAQKNPGATIFAHGENGGVIMLAVSPRRLVFHIEGNLGSEHIIGVLQEARAAGLLERDDFSALVEMRDFTGVIDWKVIPQVSEVMPKGSNRENRNAYVVRNVFFDMLTKVNAVLFPDTKHQTFRTEEEARAWLGWD